MICTVIHNPSQKLQENYDKKYKKQKMYENMKILNSDNIKI